MEIKEKEAEHSSTLFCFIQVDSTTSPGLGDGGGFSMGDVVTQMTGRGNSHKRLQRLLERRFNVSSTLPKVPYSNFLSHNQNIRVLNKRNTIQNCRHSCHKG